MRRNIVSPAAVVGVLALAVGVWIGSSRQAPPTTSVLPSQGLAAAAPHAAVDTSHETNFVSIAPCRLVDTRRKGGRITPGSLRYFRATGAAGYSAQGGSPCGIPASATAMAASIVAPDATGAGALKAWAGGTAEPLTTFLNYVKGLPLRGSGTIRIDGKSARAFRIATYTHSTNVIVDVTGYFIGQLWAHVNSDASFSGSSRATGAGLTATNAYRVDFDRDVTRCSYQVTPEGDQLSAQVAAFPDDPHGVYITFRSGSAINQLAAFSVFVSC